MRKIKIILITGIVVTIAWCGTVGFYITTQIGWDALAFLLPHELGAFSAGVFAPLAFLWLMLVYLAGRARVTDVAVALEKRLGQLIYPISALKRWSIPWNVMAQTWRLPVH